MLKDVIDKVINVLKKNGVNDVYSAFDNISTESKGKHIYSVVGVSEFESSTPVYSLSYIYLPFKTDVEIRIVGAKESSLYAVYSYFDEKIQPSVLEMTAMNCSMKKLSMKFDSNIQRIVMSVRFSASGVTKLERSSYEY